MQDANNVQVSIDQEAVYRASIQSLRAEIIRLQICLEHEKGLRREAEREVTELRAYIEALPKPRTKKERQPIETECSEFMPNGKHKPRPAESIRSYADFKAMQDYFLSQNSRRDWMMWTMGVSLGLRISDLYSLKFRYLLNENGTFRERIFLHEQKTGKLQNCLITEAVRYALTEYIASIGSQYHMDDYIFSSQKTKGKEKMAEKYGWKILSDAGKAIGLPIVVGSHTMRKSFANIAACVDTSYVDMNTVVKVQGLLNHSDQKNTMRYLGTYQTMYDKAREAVSDFVMGKTNVNEIVAGTGNSIDDIMSKLESLEERLFVAKELMSNKETYEQGVEE